MLLQKNCKYDIIYSIVNVRRDDMEKKYEFDAVIKKVPDLDGAYGIK